MKRMLAAAGLALALSWGGLATAQQPSPRERAGAELMDAFLRAADFAAMMRKQMPALSSGLSREPWFKAEWRPLLEEAFLEEMAHDRDKVGLIMGRGVADVMSEDEMRAGLALLQTEGGRAMIAAAGRGDRNPPKLTRQQQRDMERVLATPAGRGFASKMDRIDFSSKPARYALLAEIFPGVLRRFGEKVEALDARP